MWVSWASSVWIYLYCVGELGKFCLDLLSHYVGELGKFCLYLLSHYVGKLGRSCLNLLTHWLHIYMYHYQ